MSPARPDVGPTTWVAALLVVAVSVLAVGLVASRSDPVPERVEGVERVERGTTLFGSNTWRAPGETTRDAVTRVDSTYGPLAIVRIFASGLPPSWDDLARDVGRRPLVVSFRPSPALVLSGSLDDALAEWFRSAPDHRDTFWVYFHEPEDDAELGHFSPQEFTEAWAHVAELAAAVDNPRLHATVVLMCWTANERSGRDWRSYVPADGTVDVLAWDCYAKGTDADTYADVASLLEPARRASAESGADWAIGEVGARIASGADGTDRAAWLEEVGAYASGHGARFVAYFDAPIGGEFRLVDEPSIRVWARMVGSS